MYQKLPNLVIGFHGCDRSVFERVVFRGEPFVKSQNEYDWLGHGIYFWENDEKRAYEWALSLKSAKKILYPIGENEGFIPPAKGCKALYISLATDKKFRLKTDEMFILSNGEINKYYFI